MYDPNNFARMIKGKITNTLVHASGLKADLMHETVSAITTIPIIQRMNVSMIIELGTAQGGFTKLLEDACPDAEIHTFDKSNQSVKNHKYFGSKVKFYKENILVQKKTVMNLLTTQKRKLLYCDNGNKKKEVKIYSGFLHLGDFIGVHDWGREILYKDVEDYLGNWERIEWSLVEEYGALSRFWRR